MRMKWAGGPLSFARPHHPGDGLRPARPRTGGTGPSGANGLPPAERSGTPELAAPGGSKAAAANCN
eukprot:scaffold6247_cov416-Prasinococcus_capsulatus_cf.AAC.7